MIYYVEDDINVRNLAIYALEQAGLEVEGFATGSELDVACVRALPNLILLDIMLPGEDGISILRRLRQRAATRNIPVMMLTAKGSEFDVVTGLD
jgi:two-component system alkaline phosphatase synthesis response regulator PhoP